MQQNFFVLNDSTPALLIMTDCESYVKKKQVLTQEMVGLY